MNILTTDEEIFPDPMRFKEREPTLLRRWYATPDTEIGGWVVTTSPKPYDQQDHRLGELAAANFVGEGLARHIAEIHNVWLDRCHEEIEYHVSPHRGCILR
jgi:hypothetical protein